MTRERTGDPNVLISVVASAATGFLILSADGAWRNAVDRPGAFLAFLAVTAALQLVSVEVYNRGAISFSGTGLLALGFAFGPGAAMAAAGLMGVVNLVRRRGRLNRGVFDTAQFALAAGAGAAVFEALGGGGLAPWARTGAAVAAAAAYMTVNVGLLCCAMSLAEGERVVSIWAERFRWFTPYFLASGPLALALTVAYEKMGPTGLLAFALPPAFMMISIRQYLARTRAAVEEVRQANVGLAQANEDLHELFELAGGLAARAHDGGTLVEFVEEALSRITGTAVTVDVTGETAGIELNAGGTRVGTLSLAPVAALDGSRWQRLCEAVVPQIATALESAQLVEKVRRTHRDTIASLSRSMEAKDYYTGGHTERVSEIAVAVARRLGYAGADLDAIEIGALLHDIGKIGIPERILHKPGPLDGDEWKVMREHPIISDYILSDIDLHPIVRQIARSSHERIDGMGYPDALRGAEIPLPARIVLVADAFDALTSDRPYRPARHTVAAVAELRNHAGTQFCSTVLAALDAVMREEPEIFGTPKLYAVEVA